MKVNMKESGLRKLVMETVRKTIMEMNDEEGWREKLARANDMLKARHDNAVKLGRYPEEGEEGFIGNSGDFQDLMKGVTDGVNQEFGYENGDEKYGLDADDIDPVLVTKNYGKEAPPEDSDKPGVWMTARATDGKTDSMYPRVSAYPRTAQTFGMGKVPSSYSPEFKDAIIRGNQAISQAFNGKPQSSLEEEKAITRDQIAEAIRRSFENYLGK